MGILNDLFVCDKVTSKSKIVTSEFIVKDIFSFMENGCDKFYIIDINNNYYCINDHPYYISNVYMWKHIKIGDKILKSRFPIQGFSDYYRNLYENITNGD
jgi:hypothetical protein